MQVKNFSLKINPLRKDSNSLFVSLRLLSIIEKNDNKIKQICLYNWSTRIL